MHRKLQIQLGVVQRFFQGEITRAELLDETLTTQAFVAVAIFLSAPSMFMSEDTTTCRTLRHDMTTSISYCFYDAARAHDWSPYRLRTITISAKRWGLYTTGSRKAVIILTPPPELLELVRRYGCNQHVKRFLKEAATQPQANDKFKLSDLTESIGSEDVSAERDTAPLKVEGFLQAAIDHAEVMASDAEALIASYQSKYGPAGLAVIRDAINKHLGDA